MFTFRKFGWLPSAALLLGVGGLGAAHADPAYIIQDLGTLNSTYPNSMGTGIDAFGDVSGYYVGNGGSPGQALAVDDLGDYYSIGTLKTNNTGSSFALGINDSGAVVGQADSNSGSPRAFVWQLDNYGVGHIFDLGAGDVSDATAINNRGQITGALTAGGALNAFFYDDSTGVLTDIGTPGLLSTGNDVAIDGKVVGYQALSSGSALHQAFETGSNGFGWTNLGFLPSGNSSTAIGINLADQAVGTSTYDSSGDKHAFRTASGAAIASTSSLGALTGGTNSVADGINSLGQVVGYSEITGAVHHAFLYDTAIHDLNTLVNPYQFDSLNAFVLTEAERINDYGQIVGNGTFEGQTHGFVLTPNELTALVLAPAVLPGGATTTATLTLRDPAPSGGLPVSLTSSLPNLVSVPATVTVPEGQTSTTFTVTPVSTTGNYNFATITAQTYNGLATATVREQPTQSTTLSLAPAQVYGGAAFTGTVTLNNPAPSGGTPVSLKSANPSLVSVPRSVTVPAGSTSAPFTGTAKSPTKTATSVVLTATGSGLTNTATLTVLPTVVSSVSIAPGPAICGDTSATGTVTLSGPAPAPNGATITLSSNNTGLTFPNGHTFTIAAGSASGQFSVATAQRSDIQIATVSASYQGVAATTTETLKPTVAGSTAPNTLVLAPNYVYGLYNSNSSSGGASSYGYVTLPAAAGPNGTTVHLSSSDSSVYFDSSTFVIGAGNTVGQFNIYTAAVSTLKAVTIKATYTGGSASANLNLQPTSLSTNTAAPASFPGLYNATGSGSSTPSSTGTVTLTNPAPYPNGTTVTLSSSSPSVASVPANVVVPYNATTASFPITAAAVKTATAVTLTAVGGGVTKTFSVTVQPTTLAAVSAGPSYAYGLYNANGSGDTTASSNGTVTLNSPAPYPNGTTVTLSSSNTSVISVPANVVVPYNSTSAAFGIITAAVKTPTAVTLTAVGGGVTRTTVVTVEPTTLATLTPVTSSLYGGNTQTALVTLTAPAPYPNGTTVALSSSTSLASVPANVVVPYNATTATFTITAPYAVATPSYATITATGNGVAETLPVTLLPTVPTYVSVAPNNNAGGVTAGTSVTGTVTLSYPAPYPDGRTVSLTTSDGNIAVPASVNVPSGATSATFTVNAGVHAAGRTATITAIVTGVKVTTRVSATN